MNIYGPLQYVDVSLPGKSKIGHTTPDSLISARYREKITSLDLLVLLVLT